MRLLPTLSAALTAAVGLSLVAAGPAQAKAGPPAPAPGTHLMMDARSAPALSTMASWQQSSPYSAIGVYIPVASSMDDRSDKVQSNLTASWVGAVRAGGWQVLPIYVGRQAPNKCTSGNFHYVSGDVATAASQGRAAADDAAASAKSLGISASAPIMYDMEAYTAGCKTNALRAYYDAWTRELHAQGRMSGIYGSRDSTITDVASLPSHGQQGPDVVWVATASGQAQTASLPPLPAGSWAGKRINQFNLGVTRTYGGTSIDIDESAVDDTVWDTTPPSSTLPELPLATEASKVTFDWSASDGTGSGVASFEIRTKDAAFGKSLGGWSKPKKLAHSVRKVKLSRGEQWCAQVRATDRAGNTSGWSATRCTTRVADDRVLGADHSWRHTHAGSAYAHTLSTAKHKHATLSTRSKVKKVGSVGVLLRGSGRLVVRIGGHKVGTVSGTGLVWLHLQKVHHGRLQLVTTSKKKVKVDGIALRRQ